MSEKKVIPNTRVLYPEEAENYLCPLLPHIGKCLVVKCMAWTWVEGEGAGFCSLLFPQS